MAQAAVDKQAAANTIGWRFKQLITAFPFLDGLALRTAALSIAFAFVVAMIADVAYPMLTTPVYDQIAAKLAADAQGQAVEPQKIMQTLQQYNLAWYYITDAGGKVTASTRAYSPALPAASGNASHMVEWRSKRYWEAVAPISPSSILHIGFCISPILYAQLFNPFGILQPCPLSIMLCVFIGSLAAAAMVLHYCVTKPLEELTAACSTAGGAEFDTVATIESIDVSNTVGEVKRLVDVVHQLAIRGTQSQAALSLAESMSVSAAEKEKQLEQDIATTRNKIGEFYTKDAEEEFISGLLRELDTLKSTHQVCQRLLDKLSDKFPTSIVYGVFFKVASGEHYAAEAFLGFDDRNVQNIKRIEHARIAREAENASGLLIIKRNALPEYGLQSILAGTDIKTAVYLLLSYQGRKLGMLAVYFRAEGHTVDDRVRLLRNAAGAVSRLLYEVTIYELELQAALTDPLTGVRNKKFFMELAPKVIERASANPQERPLSLVALNLDQLKTISETLGQDSGDMALKALAATIRQCVRTSDGDGKSMPGDFLIRSSSDDFVIVMENTDGARATGVAERIAAAVCEKSDWPAKIGKCTLSCGIATYPADGKSIQELLLKAQTAVFYVRDELGSNQACHIRQVPATYQAESQSAAIGGELGVFDPAALLQSLSTAQKTGILEVHSPDGKQLWMVFASGKPIQARLGKQAGGAAIVEFVTTFEEGSFSFQEKTTNNKNTMTNMPVLEVKYNVTQSLERCLMSGAVAQDTYVAAKSIIPSTAIVIRPIAPVEFSARWQALSQLPDPPSSDDFNIMSEIVQRSDGKLTLAEIFAEIDSYPTHILFRGASLLVQHSLVNKKPAVPV